jgi:hypothetical protein
VPRRVRFRTEIVDDCCEKEEADESREITVLFCWSSPSFELFIAFV